MKITKRIFAVILTVLMILPAMTVGINAYTPMLDLFQTTTGSTFSNGNWVAYGYNPYSSAYGEMFAGLDHAYRASVSDLGGVWAFNYVQNVNDIQNSIDPKQVISSTHATSLDGLFLQLNDQGSPTADEYYKHYSEMCSIGLSAEPLTGALNATSFDARTGFAVENGMLRNGIVITYRNTDADYIYHASDNTLPVYDTITASVISDGVIVDTQSYLTSGGQVGLVAGTPLRLYFGYANKQLVLHLEDIINDDAIYTNQTYVFADLDTSSISDVENFYISVGRGTTSSSLQDTTGSGKNAAVHVHIDKIGTYVYDIANNTYTEDCPVPVADWPYIPEEEIDPVVCDHVWGEWYYASEEDKPTAHEIGKRTRVCTICGYEDTRPVTVIANEDDLMWFANEINVVGDYTLDGIVVAEKLDMAGYSWTPIGNTTYGYAGVFEGNECEIENLNGMLFGTTNNAEILEIGVNSGTYFEDAHASSAYTGALVGNMQGGRLINCYSRANYTGDYSTTVAGLCGRAYGIMRDCYFAGTLGNGANAIVGFYNSNVLAKSRIVNCFYANELSDANYLYTGDKEQAADNYYGRTNREFAAGIVTALLGSPYDQIVGVDTFPYFGDSFKVSPKRGRSVQDVLDCPVMGDVVFSGDYRYVYYGENTFTGVSANDAGWNVLVRDAAKTSYHALPSEVVNIQGTGDVKTLGKTFANCLSMTEAPAIPETVTVLYTTYRKTPITEAPVIPEGVKIMVSTFRNCPNLTAMPEIPSTVVDMTDAFYGCSVLTETTPLPDGLVNMYGTFMRCTSLVTAPEIPSTVTDLSRCFKLCTSLTSTPTIKAGVNVFQTYSSTNITEVYVDADVTEIPRGTFNACYKLKNVYFAGTMDEWVLVDVASYNTQFNKATKHYAIDTPMSVVVNKKNSTFVCDLDENIKDIFFAKGELSTYQEVKAAHVFRATATKLAGLDYYRYDTLTAGDYTLFVRYNDGTTKSIFFTVPELAAEDIAVTE